MSTGMGCDLGEGPVFDHWIALPVLHVTIAAEAEIVVLQLRRCVDPSALIAAKRSFLVIAADDVLAQLRTDRFEEVAQVSNDGKVAQQRVLLLSEVVGGHTQHCGDRHRRQDACPAGLH
jgi:hypothetical protein